MTPGKAVDKLINRLADTRGRRTARRNARNALRRALRSLWGECDKTWPPIRLDGTEVVRKKRGAFCSACSTPMKDFATLGRHLGTRHGRRAISVGGSFDMGPGLAVKCWCGKSFAARSIARHLASIKDLEAHFTLGALGEGIR